MTLTPGILLRAYAAGIFPMADSADDPELYWVDPEQRGVLPLDAFHIPHRLRRTIRSGIFEVRCNTAFTAVMQGCAEPAPDRPNTWINDEILKLYGALHLLGHAHSVETWYDGNLVGGLYGVSLGGVFCGESMFTLGGFTLLDTQFVTEHLRRFGAIEIPRAEYQRRLRSALKISAHFPEDLAIDPVSVLQSRTQTS